MRIGNFVAAISIMLVVLAPTAPAAHEFWIAPLSFTVQPRAQVSASLRVGLMMRGDDLPYLSSAFDVASLTTRAGTVQLRGNEGDIPAISYNATEPGLHVLAYHSKPLQVTYDSWAQFLQFLSYEGLDELAEAHRARGLPETGIREAYSRSAKALVRVGKTEPGDHDRPVGLPLELVAEDNPYTEGVDTVVVRLLRKGDPLPHRQVAVLRYDGQVMRTLLSTDELGRVFVPTRGGGSFLINAVDVQPVDGGPVAWASEWASLTFGLPIAVPRHPLDPLAPIEMASALKVVAASGRLAADTRVSLVTLAEPAKEAVLTWKLGDPPLRKALVVLRSGRAVIEALVDLAGQEIEAWTTVPNVQPPISSDEWALAQSVLKQDARWLAAIRARGFEDISAIFCESLTAGFFDIPEERGRRLLRMPCYDIAGAKTNVYARPIEGLIATVDLDSREVMSLVDEPASTPRHLYEFDEASLGSLPSPMRPIRTTAPQGWNFSIDERVVNWAGWSFHLGFDQRFGPVLSLVTHEDGPLRRMVLYQGHLSEIFVPYMDGSAAWSFRSYMDAGEYGLGILASPLHPGIDCPERAVFLGAALARAAGEVYPRPRVLCVFERDTAAPLWRHWEALNGHYEGRPATELVVRSAPTVGNYDYILDWVFTQSGEIRIELGATGIAAVKATAPDRAAAENGTLVAPGLIAVNHDHFFSFRLDLDIDGQQNDFVRERLDKVALPKDSARRSAWQTTRVPVSSEGPVSALHGSENWRIESVGDETALGHHRAYLVEIHGSATSLLDNDDFPQRRAGFSAENLWLTVRHPDELFAAGRYPNQSPGGDGLPSYANGESLTHSDLVAWCTVGFHHVTRPEDWPVLPTVWHSVRLRPSGFFDHNPALAVRREFAR